jgi:hypothetical protein
MNHYLTPDPEEKAGNTSQEKTHQAETFLGDEVRAINEEQDSNQDSEFPEYGDVILFI